MTGLYRADLSPVVPCVIWLGDICVWNVVLLTFLVFQSEIVSSPAWGENLSQIVKVTHTVLHLGTQTFHSRSQTTPWGWPLINFSTVLLPGCLCHKCKWKDNHLFVNCTRKFIRFIRTQHVYLHCNLVNWLAGLYWDMFDTVRIFCRHCHGNNM